jgi:hypothetical protein
MPHLLYYTVKQQLDQGRHLVQTFGVLGAFLTALKAKQAPGFAMDG